MWISMAKRSYVMGATCVWFERPWFFFLLGRGWNRPPLKLGGRQWENVEEELRLRSRRVAARVDVLRDVPHLVRF